MLVDIGETDSFPDIKTYFPRSLDTPPFSEASRKETGRAPVSVVMELYWRGFRIFCTFACQSRRCDEQIALYRY